MKTNIPALFFILASLVWAIPERLAQQSRASGCDEAHAGEPFFRSMQLHRSVIKTEREALDSYFGLEPKCGIQDPRYRQKINQAKSVLQKMEAKTTAIEVVIAALIAVCEELDALRKANYGHGSVRNAKFDELEKKKRSILQDGSKLIVEIDDILNSELVPIEREAKAIIDADSVRRVREMEAANARRGKGSPPALPCPPLTGGSPSGDTRQPSVPPDLADRLMKVAAQMDCVATDVENKTLVAADHFFGGVAETVRDTATFLAQEPGVPAQQLARTIGAYMTNSNEANHRALYAAALQAVEEKKRDPARFYGKNLPNLLMLRGAISDLEASSQGILAMEGENRALTGSEGYGSCSLRGINPSPPPSSRPPVNPYFGSNNCFACAKAQLKAWRTGKPYIALDEDPVFGKGTIPLSYIVKNLKENFGGPNAKNPYHKNYGLQMHADGLPVKSSESEIDAALKTAASEMQRKGVRQPQPAGMVFIERTNGTKHIAVARLLRNGKSEFSDPQVDQPLDWNGVKKVRWYRTD